MKSIPDRNNYVADIINGSKPMGNDKAGDYFRQRGIYKHLDNSGILFNPAVTYWRKGEDGQPVQFGEYPAMISIINDATGNMAGIHMVFFDIRSMHPKVRRVMLHDSTGGAVEIKSGSPFSAGVCVGIVEAMAIRELYPDLQMYACLTDRELLEFIPPAKWQHEITLFRPRGQRTPMHEFEKILLETHGYRPCAIDSYSPERGKTWSQQVAEMPRAEYGGC